jgi:hypothetical protein
MGGARHTPVRAGALLVAYRGGVYSRRMQAVLHLAAHNLRARWRGWAVLALLVGWRAERC